MMVLLKEAILDKQIWGLIFYPIKDQMLGEAELVLVLLHKFEILGRNVLAELILPISYSMLGYHFLILFLPLSSPEGQIWNNQELSWICLLVGLGKILDKVLYRVYAPHRSNS